MRDKSLARVRQSVFGNRADASCRRQKLCCGPTPEEPPKALQTSECDELLDLARTSCLILVQRQPGKFNVTVASENSCLHLTREQSLVHAQLKKKPPLSRTSMVIESPQYCAPKTQILPPVH